jgi:S1-C subfamily serine protease
MSYSLAQETGSNVTYGWRIQSIVRGGPSDDNLQVGDIIIKMNTQTIKNNDDLASFLEEHTLPGDTISLVVIRNNAETPISITLGLRPDPT